MNGNHSDRPIYPRGGQTPARKEPQRRSARTALGAAGHTEERGLNEDAAEDQKQIAGIEAAMQLYRLVFPGKQLPWRAISPRAVK